MNIDKIKILFLFSVQTNKGFSGIVKDKESQKNMVNATIKIEGFSWTFHVNEEARFHIYLPPGSYQVTVSCHGYQNYKKVKFPYLLIMLAPLFLFYLLHLYDSVLIVIFIQICMVSILRTLWYQMVS